MKRTVLIALLVVCLAALTATSASGDIDLTQAGRIEALRLETASGEIRAALDDVGRSSVTSTSGDIGQVVAGAEKAALSSTSGNIRFQAAAFGEVTIASTSGDVTAALPAQPGFTADIRTASGGFECGIAMAKDGKTYTCGDGSDRVSIHTTSGDIRLQ